MDKKLLALIGALALVAVWFFDAAALLPLRLFVVFFHEAGHALAAWAVGGSVDSIRVAANEGGLTMFRASPALLPQLVVSSGGYLGSAVFGAILLFAAARARSGRPVLYALAAFVVFAGVLWVRDLFTAGFTLAAALVLAGLGRVLPGSLSRAAALFLGVFTGLYALHDIRSDLFRLGASRGTDADRLAELTYVPALVWAALWAALALLLLAGAVKLAARRRAPSLLPPIPAGLAWSAARVREESD